MEVRSANWKGLLEDSQLHLGLSQGAGRVEVQSYFSLPNSLCSREGQLGF